MLSNEPGWYPDPDGGRQVRFWDGDGWTEYVQPFAPVLTRPSGSDTALEDYPYLLDADLRTPNEPRIVSTWTRDAVLAPPPKRPRRSALRWWIIGASVVLVVALVAVVGALRTSAPPLTDPSPSSTVQGGDAATVGSPASVAIPAAGSAQVSVVVPSDGAFFVEATSPGEDLSAELSLDGAPVWSGDDRRSELEEVVGGSWRDPGAFLELSAGTYTMTVTEHDSLATTATVAIYAVETVDVAPGQTLDVSVPENGYTVLRLTLPADTAVSVDVRASGALDDLRLMTFPGGRATVTDDRGPDVAASKGGSEYDPYLETTFPAGTTFLLLDEYARLGVTATVTVTAL